MGWKDIRIRVLNALARMGVVDVYYMGYLPAERLLTIGVILPDVDKIRKAILYRMMEDLIQLKDPDLYKRFRLCYEIWDERQWDVLPLPNDRPIDE